MKINKLFHHIGGALCFFGMVVSVNAKTSTDAWLKQVQQSHQDATFISAQFRQEKKVKFISKPLVSQGQFQFANKVGLNWQIEQPFFARTLFLPKGVFKVAADGQVSEEKDRATRAVAELLQSLFSGQWQSLNDKFNIGKREQLDNNRWQVTLTATDQWVRKAVQFIQLQGKSNEQYIKRIILRDAKDNLTTITLSNWAQQTTPLHDKQRLLFQTN